MEQLSFEDAFRAELGERARPPGADRAGMKFVQTMPYPCGHEGCPNKIEFFEARSHTDRPKYCPDHGGPKEPAHG